MVFCGLPSPDLCNLSYLWFDLRSNILAMKVHVSFDLTCWKFATVSYLGPEFDFDLFGVYMPP